MSDKFEYYPSSIIGWSMDGWIVSSQSYMFESVKNSIRKVGVCDPYRRRKCEEQKGCDAVVENSSSRKPSKWAFTKCRKVTLSIQENQDV